MVLTSKLHSSVLRPISNSVKSLRLLKLDEFLTKFWKSIKNLMNFEFFLTLNWFWNPVKDWWHEKKMH